VLAHALSADLHPEALFEGRNAFEHLVTSYWRLDSDHQTEAWNIARLDARYLIEAWDIVRRLYSV
jgi:hypothetical protein